MHHNCRKGRDILELAVLGTILLIGWGILGSPTMADDLNKAWESANTAGMQAYRQKRYADAKQWFLQALAEAERNPEPTPSRAMTLNNLASVHEALGEDEEAELRYQQSLSVVEAIQGPNHPDLVPGLNNLAVLYVKRGQIKQAELLLSRSHKILESFLGSTHPHLIPNLMLLAQITQVDGRFENAEKYYSQALTIAENELRPGHPQTVTVLHRYAAFLKQANRQDEARQLEERIKTMKNASPQQVPSP